MAYEDDEENGSVALLDDEEEQRRRASLAGPVPSITDESDQTLAAMGRQEPAVSHKPLQSITGPSEPTAQPTSITAGPLDAQPKAGLGPAAQREHDLLGQGPPKYHGIKKVFDVLGRITAPGQGIEESLGVGTRGYEANLGRAHKAAAEEQQLSKAPLDVSYEQAKTEEQQARAKKETAAANAPPKKQFENIAQLHADAVQEAITRNVDPAKDPKVLQIEDSIQRIQKETPVKPDTQTQEDQRYEQIKTNAVMKKPITPEDAAWAQAYEKRKTLTPFATAVAQAPQKGTERSDKSYTLHSGRLDKLSLPVDQIMQRFGRLKDTLDQGSPQADALVAPELLSVMSGGQGSGLRMNEAEIARIVGGRSAWESLKASINHWKTNPDDARSITPDQDRQIRALVETVHGKLIQKQQIIEEAQSALVGSDDPIEHRKIVVGAQKKLDAIDAGEVSPHGEKKETGAAAGTSTPAAAFQVPKGAPEAPKQDGKVLKADGKVIAKSQAGQWVKP
jgi:hypothetical protein